VLLLLTTVEYACRCYLAGYDTAWSCLLHVFVCREEDMLFWCFRAFSVRLIWYLVPCSYAALPLRAVHMGSCARKEVIRCLRTLMPYRAPTSPVFSKLHIQHEHRSTLELVTVGLSLSPMASRLPTHYTGRERFSWCCTCTDALWPLPSDHLSERLAQGLNRAKHTRFPQSFFYERGTGSPEVGVHDIYADGALSKLLQPRPPVSWEWRSTQRSPAANVAGVWPKAPWLPFHALCMSAF
jgi:hypothetical protein